MYFSNEFLVFCREYLDDFYKARQILLDEIPWFQMNKILPFAIFLAKQQNIKVYTTQIEDDYLDTEAAFNETELELLDEEESS